jgi:hypothetical protein
MRRFFINNYEVAESTVWGSKPEISLTEVDISGLVKREGEIRAHVFLCMLAYYVEWHMRAELSELLFDDHEREAAEATRESIVSKAPRSEAAKQKDYQRRTSDGFPVQSFQCLLKDLATLCKNRVRWDSHPETEFDRLTEPTPLQQRVFEILDLSLSS